MGFLRYVRACAVCQKFYPPADWLCSACWSRLKSELLRPDDVYRAEKNFSHLRLFDWHEENDRFMRRLIDSLKGGGPKFVFGRLGMECFSRFVHTPLWARDERPVFVPAPPRGDPLKDHARRLAEALAARFNGEVCPVLRKKRDDSSQRQKTRRERGLIELSAGEGLKKGAPCVFADDTLTTGATARAAFRALGSPKQFFVFTLAYRRPPESWLED